MREVVYLSEGKLNAFLPKPRRALPAVTVQAGLPFAEISVERPPPDGARELRRHLRRVEKTLARRALWYTEPGLAAGRWVRFKAPLTWMTLRGEHRDLVLFVDPAPDPAHPRGAGAPRRLLLHGSARHLLGRPPVQVDGPEQTGLADGGGSAGTVFVTNAGRVVGALAHVDDGPGADGEERPEPAVPLPRGGVRDLLAALDAGSAEVSTAAMVTGYARVSALLPGTDAEAGCLVASPLIVEYADS
ncbi:SAVMC3_10250 family protein [Streptomyces sp. NPDC049879]|uniref:SAVMC3_10250 family protein n=1 Tax=Streptomyces sp. NPDC049879 TaxID=3365598 RepID=UPI0037AE5F96